METLKEFCTVLLGQQLKIYNNHKNITWKNLNTDRVLWLKTLLEEYGLDIKYILGNIYIAVYVLSRLPNNGNQETTHESTYLMEIMLELYNIKYLLEGAFPISFKIMYHYQQEEPILTEKLKCAEYKNGSFRRGRNTIKLVMFKNK